MTPELIAAFFTGLTALVGGAAAISANRQRRTLADMRAMRKRLRKLERWVLAYDEHTFDLERRLTQAGVKVPPRPPALDELDDDDEDEDDDYPAPSAGPVPTSRGKT